MSKRLDENLGAVEYDGLIVSNVPGTDVVTVKIAAGNGTLKRGTLVTGTPGGELAPVNAALVATKATFVLTDEVNASAVAVATAYRCGHFARNKLIVAEGYALTAADEEVLRNAGILLSDAIEY